MKLYFLGICGTFMAGVAQIAKSLGHEVGGCDSQVYPPMSDVLLEQGIKLDEGYHEHYITDDIDLILMGNAMKRGMPIVEKVLNDRLNYLSAPQWLAQEVLPDYKVISVSGTHGKTTTSSMISWILTHAGLDPSYIIAGVDQNLNATAKLGAGEYFVIEADEYDSAFFDKRPKFIHYHPQIAVLNNLEFDHGDIYADIDAIKQQFHFFVRTIAGNGLIIANQCDDNLQQVLKQGCWSKVQRFGFSQQADWQTIFSDKSDVLRFTNEGVDYSTNWNLTGSFNQDNAVAAIAACYQAGVNIEQSMSALKTFQSVKRRMELIVEQGDITLYDDFAHHPTAIKATCQALKQRHPGRRLISIVLFGSYTMRSGLHADSLRDSLSDADLLFTVNPDFGLPTLDHLIVCFDENSLFNQLEQTMEPGDVLVIMSNKDNVNLIKALTNSITNC